VSVPPPIINLANTPPDIRKKVSLINAYAGDTLRYTVGIPYDQQEDYFYLSEWGIKSMPKEDWPTWISWKN